jgi:serine/threonine protein phosphatase PrpC
VNSPKFDIAAIEQYGRQHKQNNDIFAVQNVGGLSPVIYETQGKRPTQEDHYIISRTDKRSPDTVKQFLKDAFEKIHTRVVSESVTDGSTANIAYISADTGTVTVANCGDSRSVVFIRNITTGEISTIPLSYDHKPNDPKEKARIERAGGTVDNINGVYRVNGELAVARSFGDFNIKGYNGAELITHKPDIIQVELGKYINDPNCEVFIINSCDGLYESKDDILQEKHLVDVAKQYLGKGSSDGKNEGLGKILARTALYAGSGDNITVNIVKLTKNQKEDVIIGVFDGHGGSHTSSLAAEEMRSIAATPKEKTIETFIHRKLLAIKKPGENGKSI